MLKKNPYSRNVFKLESQISAVKGPAVNNYHLKFTLNAGNHN